MHINVGPTGKIHRQPRKIPAGEPRHQAVVRLIAPGDQEEKPPVAAEIAVAKVEMTAAEMTVVVVEMTVAAAEMIVVAAEMTAVVAEMTVAAAVARAGQESNIDRTAVPDRRVIR